MTAPYRMYQIGNGEYVMIGVQSNRDWVSFATHVLGDPEASVPALGAHDPAFIEHLLTRAQTRLAQGVDGSLP